MWLKATLELSFPQHLVVFGSHRITTLRKESNVITSIRSPKDCIPSYMLFFNHDNPERLLDWYCRFMAGTIECADRIFVTRFEQVTTEPESVMLAYADRFGLEQPQPVTPAKVKAKVLETHPEHLPKPPTPARIEANKAVLASPSLSVALDLYEHAKLIQEPRMAGGQLSGTLCPTR
jgi:hypothetical protein